MATRQIPGPTGRLFIDDGGKGGVPVIFIHSFAGNTTHWASQLMHLRGSRRAVAFDLRGHGNSDPPPANDYSIPSLCRDLEAVLTSLNLRKCVLVGHSLGGAVASAFAGSHAERLLGIVLVETPGNIPTEEADQILSWLESDYDNVIRTYWEKLLSRAQPQVSSQIRSDMSAFNRDAVMAIVRAIFEFNPLPALAGYRGPKLVVTTTHNESPHDIHKVLPDIPFRTLPGTSHWVHMDRPVDFNLLLDEFLGTIEIKKVGQKSRDDDTQVKRLLERLGHALSERDVRGVSECWETPAVILSDEGASVFRDKAKIEKMVGGMAESYQSQGLHSTRPVIERIQRLSDTLAEVDVRWPAFDAAGVEKASEHTHYIIHFGKDGQPRIQVALSRTRGLSAA